jgi:hypothetical protein
LRLHIEEPNVSTELRTLSAAAAAALLLPALLRCCCPLALLRPFAATAAS